MTERSADGSSLRLSYERTNLSHERTLMAWVRTATSLITFGFAIYKFFQLEAGEELLPRRQIIGPRRFAMLMIGIGLFALLTAAVQNWQYRRRLLEHYPDAPRSLATLVAGLIALLGILAMAAVVFKV